MGSTQDKNQRLRRKSLKQQREARIAILIKGGYIRNAEEVPADAIPANIAAQNMKLYCQPYRPEDFRRFYQDKPFVCRDCGKNEVWKAEDQQWYFEIAKGSILNDAVRCRECRKKKLDQKKSDKPSATE